MGDVTIDGVLRAGDLGRIVEQHGRLYRAEYGFDERFEGYVAAGIAEAILSEQPAGARFWIVRRGDEFLGSAAVCRAGPASAQFRWFLLDPALRGLGIGRRLLAAALEYSASVGYERVFLWTVDGLDASAALYRGAGFAEAERRAPSAPWGVPVTEVRWELVLDGNAEAGVASINARWVHPHGPKRDELHR